MFHLLHTDPSICRLQIHHLKVLIRFIIQCRIYYPIQWPQPKNEEILLAMEEVKFEEKNGNKQGAWEGMSLNRGEEQLRCSDNIIGFRLLESGSNATLMGLFSMKSSNFLAVIQSQARRATKVVLLLLTPCPLYLIIHLLFHLCRIPLVLIFHMLFILLT
ncbi:unnamed protein product [Brassica oleracea]